MSKNIHYKIKDLSRTARVILNQVKSKNILFYGEIGSGKTTLISALVKELGGITNISSPTFSIVNEYGLDDDVVYHFDFYRINEIHEVYDIGIEDYLDSKQWIFIEWPEKIREILPLKSDISYIKLNKNGSRTLNIEPFEENID